MAPCGSGSTTLLARIKKGLINKIADTPISSSSSVSTPTLKDDSSRLNHHENMRINGIWAQILTINSMR